MRHRLPPLNALRLFEASARLLSFKNAAEELLLTPSAVSHGIQSLEDWLQTPLFIRTSRGLLLSEAGKDYYPVVREALSLLEQGSNSLAHRYRPAQLSLSVAPTFAARWLLPRLSKFRARHPEITVNIDTSHERVDLETGRADLAIRMGRGGWQGLAANPLIREVLIPVCSPALLPHVQDADWEDAPLIHLTSVREDWAGWARAKGKPAPDLARGLCVDTIQMAMEAAGQGLGIALGRRPLIDADLANGRVVELWGPPVRGSTYWLVGAEKRSGDPGIAAFRGWIMQEASGPIPAFASHGNTPPSKCRNHKDHS